jgi:hypothetical protein
MCLENAPVIDDWRRAYKRWPVRKREEIGIPFGQLANI